MKRNNGSQTISLLMVLAVISIGVSYMYGILAENDQQLNVSGTGYEQTYDSNVRVQSATSSIFAPLGMIIGVLLFFSFLKFAKK